MGMVLIPILCIGGIVFYYYYTKNKVTASAGKIYDEALKAWNADRDGIIKEMFENPDKLLLLQEAIGDKPIESICPCEPKKALAKSLVKGGLEALTFRQSFDMSVYYFVIADGELNLLQSNGEMIVAHDVFSISDLRQVSIRQEDTVSKITSAFGNDGAEASKESLFFTCNGEDFSFKLLDKLTYFPVFTVEKSSDSGKFGHNPFYRVDDCSEIEAALLSELYGPESIEKFRKALL